MKHLFFVFPLYVGIVAALSSQTPTPHFVVVEETEIEIAELEDRNREMEERNAELETENAGLEVEIRRSREFIVLADDMVDRLSASAGEIYTLMQSVVDPETRRELQTRMEENRRSRYELENRKRRENEAITRAESRMDSNRKSIAVNRVRTRANEQRIEYLQACIDLSVSENRDVDSVLDNADRVRREVESLLSD